MKTLRGLTGSVLLALNTLVVGSVLLMFAVVKLAIPAIAVRRRVDALLNAVAEQWIRNNDALLVGVRWEIRGVEELSRKQWYLVISNHQSWADIFVLQKVFIGRVPFLKFFLKRRLIWVPLIGLVWWALDFPFMKRHSPEFLKANPERRGDDLAAIRRACEKFSLIPTAVMTFLEGTRFTRDKQNAEGSPYRNLLSAKAGGVALALNAMGERFHSLLDVTLFYPHGAPTFFGMLSGRMRGVVVHVREREIPDDLVSGNYAADPEFRKRAQQWIAELWREKDDLLDQLRLEHARTSAGVPSAG
ncbi:MAG: acyltransferase [Thermoanaerobaculia bacterium]